MAASSVISALLAASGMGTVPVGKETRRASAACGHLDHGCDDGARCCFSQPLTVSCHRMLFAGLSTQWLSSGKYRNLDSMPLRCSAVNALMPCDTGRSEAPTSELQSLMRISFAVFCLKN